MTAVVIDRWERRDATDRAALAQAAFDFCRAARHQGASSSRFFWLGADNVVIVTEADSPSFFDGEPKPEMAGAVFALSDLARGTSHERLLDPRSGEAAYRSAGR